MSDNQTRRSRGGRAVYLFALLAVAGATVAGLALYQNISLRKREALQTAFTLANLDESVVDPAEWGKNFPRQFDSYKRTVDIERTRHGGSEAFQRLDENPNLRAIFDGYAFSIDYREERGHAYMLSDQRETDRVTKRKQPGACLHCHASVPNAYRAAGIERGAPGDALAPLTSAEGLAQLHAGFEALCAVPYEEATATVEHPVACLDCHDPSSMQLRVTRPGFLNGIAVFAESDDPAPHLPSIERWRKGPRTTKYDPNRDASRQEMRSMACGQCHVEYYFKGEGKLLTYPWHNGLKMEQIEAYYDEVDFSDWTHAQSGAKVLKAQHPEFETWSQGIHARSGVSCADCHMPYVREGAIKVSNHHVRSPLLNIARACQPCHPYAESEILARAEIIQDRHAALLARAENAVVDLIVAIKAAADAGAPEPVLDEARAFQRKAQFRVDFCNAENSMGFHAPQEGARILGEAIDYARQGRMALIDAAAPTPVSSLPAAP